ncbi:MAG: hypothetical protein ABFS05_11360 [Bacteroidota bacterium]
MKRSLLVILGIILFTFFGNSQDIIIKKDGSEINSIVKEITPDLVKYKKYVNQDGPIYNISKGEIFMIKYENGETDIFNKQTSQQTISEPVPLAFYNGFWGLTIHQGERKLSTKDLKEIYKDYPEALSKYKSGKTLNTISNIIGIPCGFVFGWELGTMLGGGESDGATLAISGAGLIAGLVMNFAGTNNIKKSVIIYNNKIQGEASLNIRFGLTRHGVGLCFKF